DIACGMSPLLATMKKKKNCDVTVFDISNNAVEEQKKYGVKAEVNDLSSPDFSLKEDYDYIVLSEIIEHLVYPERLINKIKNKSKYLIISLPNSAFYRYRMGLLFKGRFFTQWAYHPSEHLRYWSHIDFLEWLGALGMEIVDCRASNGLNIGPFKLYNIWKNLFGHQICYLVKVI
ncbi:class I SAM-dependent methyltransferase, partial [Patescibacteria group bacterium]